MPEPVREQRWSHRIFERLSAPVPETLLLAFRRYFTIHVSLEVLKIHWRQPDDPSNLWFQILIFAAAGVSWHRRWYPIGLAVLLWYKVSALMGGWPMSGNHLYVESAVLVVLLLFSNPPEVAPGRVRGEGPHLIQLMLLSVYFYSGLQKLIHGFWYDGEYVAQALFSTDTFGFWHSIQRMLEGMAGLFSLPLPELPLTEALGLDRAPLDIPGWVIATVLVISWFTILTEIGAPLLVAWRRTRRVGIWAMLLLSTMVGILSWEVQFMFVGVGAVLLFFHQHPRRNFYTLAVIHVLWSIYVVAADIRVWVL